MNFFLAKSNRAVCWLAEQQNNTIVHLAALSYDKSAIIHRATERGEQVARLVQHVVIQISLPIIRNLGNVLIRMEIATDRNERETQTIQNRLVNSISACHSTSSKQPLLSSSSTFVLRGTINCPFIYSQLIVVVSNRRRLSKNIYHYPFRPDSQALLLFVSCSIIIIPPTMVIHRAGECLRDISATTV